MEKYYSQNKEDLNVLEYFATFKGTLLEIGANDGETFSNSLLLIQNGWNAVLVEPSPDCVEKIIALHANSKAHVNVVECAIGTSSGKAVFHESGQLNDPILEGKENASLVSTLLEGEKKRWENLGMCWANYEVDVLSWPDFLRCCEFEVGKDSFDFISIDAEGVDLEILKQINLNEVGCKCVCVEYNGNQEIKKQIIDYCVPFGLDKIIYTTGENIILAK